MSFYVELSSNSRDDDNTIGNFRNEVQLLHPLEGRWEVGMSEVSYSKTWKNITYDSIMSIENMFKPIKPFISLGNTYGYAPYKDEDRKGIIRSGFYPTVQALCDEVEKEMIPFKIDQKYLPKLFYDEINKSLVIKPGKDKFNEPTLPYLSKELAEILGFDGYSTETPRYNAMGLVIPKRPADIRAGVSSLFVYCNLILPQYIGDTRAKLLRTVEIPNDSKFGDQVVIRYDNPHYIPVINYDFNNIEIDIKDDTNSPIHFMFGRTRVKLHFRECQTLI